MLLPTLWKRHELYILGVNSGTSADGLDMAVVHVSRRKKQPVISFLEGKTRKFSKLLREYIFKVCDSTQIRIEEIIHLDAALGTCIGTFAEQYINKLSDRNISIDMIASHGQTIRHLPKKTTIGPYRVRGTMQLGSLDIIAAQTGKVVVGDFRQADIAIGGEGAPITTGAMVQMFSGKESRLIVNIGGMANYFYIPSKQSLSSIVARDCGPGNSLCDILVRELYGKPFDKNGQLAQKGRIHPPLLAFLRQQPFFTSRTVSTGRELFGPTLAKKIRAFGEKNRLRNTDLIATTAELTVISIAQAVKVLVKNDTTLKKLYLTGGGRYNKFFLKRLSYHLPEFTIGLIDELGIDGDYVEAAAYAVMGEVCLRSRTFITGTRQWRKTAVAPVLGHIVQPPLTADK